MNGGAIDEAKVMADFIATSPPTEELIVKFRELQINSPYTTEQRGLAGRYKHLMTQTFWHDLLIEAAREQGLPEPRLDPLKGHNTPLAVIDGNVQVNTPIMRRTTNQKVEPISRPARIVPTGVRTLSTVMDEYLVDMRLKLDVLNTQKKLTRWNKQFLDVMGDLEIAEIRSQHGYAYIRKVLADNPDRSNRTLKDYCWGVQNLLQYCVRSGYIETNPFRDLDLKKYGKEAEETYTYTSEEIAMIFNHNWNEQDRLLLSIVATTGMRPSEVGNMTWERFNDTEYAGIRYITTTDVDAEQIRQRIRHPVSTRKINNVSRFHGGVSPSVGLLSHNNNSTRYAANLQTTQKPDSVRAHVELPSSLNVSTLLVTELDLVPWVPDKTTLLTLCIKR